MCRAENLPPPDVGQSFSQNEPPPTHLTHFKVTPPSPSIETTFSRKLTGRAGGARQRGSTSWSGGISLKMGSPGSGRATFLGKGPFGVPGPYLP